MKAESKPTVLVFRRHLIPPSETFISEQVLAYQRWKGILIGNRRRPQDLPLDPHEVIWLDHPPSKWTRLWRRMRGLHGDPGWGGIHSALAECDPTTIARLQQTGASLMHAHFGVDGVGAWPLAEALGIPLLVTLHGYDIAYRASWWKDGAGGKEMREYPEKLLELACKSNVHFIAVSEYLYEQAISFGIPESRIATLYTGVDTDKFSPGGSSIAMREPQVLFVGRLVEMKGCRYLIEAMQHVQRSVPHTKLVIAGHGPLMANLKQLARSLAVKADFRGVVSPAEVRGELNRSRLLCLPSVHASNGHFESFGMVLLEAQAMGIPVVTSAPAGRGEAVVDGRTGFYVQERDSSALADRITALLRDDALAQSMSTAARQLIQERFDIRLCSKRLEAYYDACSGAAPIGHGQIS